MASLYGGIEAGGTKFVCVVASGPDEIAAETRFNTGAPNETMVQVIDFFTHQIKLHGPLRGIGIASFGPLDPRLNSSTYGMITSTPKPGWANYDIVGTLEETFDLPIGFDTDVDGAALGELRWGAGRGLETLVYLTIGTGIGGGAIANGQIIHGLLHTEMGHMRLPHDIEADPFPGICPYHGDCLEGLACGPAIGQRWGLDPKSLSVDHPAWRLEAEYLAYAVVNLILTLSPERVILGGGVMSQEQLFPLIRQRVIAILNDYIKSERLLGQIEQYIVSPGLGTYSGVLGAVALAMNAVESS